jgi:hypothetical protein
MGNYPSQRVSRHSFYTCSLSFAFQDKASGPFILKIYLTIYCIMNTYNMTRSCSPPRAVVPSHLMPPMYPRIEEGKVHRARHLFGQPTSQILSTLHIRYLSTTLVTWNLVSSPRFQSVSAFTIFFVFDRGCYATCFLHVRTLYTSQLLRLRRHIHGLADGAASQTG